jgi:hypothetical protein
MFLVDPGSLIPDPLVKKTPDPIQNKTADQSVAKPNRVGHRNSYYGRLGSRIRVNFFFIEKLRIVKGF